MAEEEAAALGRPGRLSSEYRLRARDGRWVWVRDEAEVVRDPAGRPVLLRGMIHDITRAKEAEEHLRRSEARVRGLLERLVRAQEEERARIADDIHDDTVQIMTAAALRIASLRRRLAAGPEAGALERLERTVDDAIHRLRRLLFELRPRALDREGLAAALRLYLDRLEQEAGLRWALLDRLAVEPDPESRMALFRIAQEALTNVRKHANARRVEVALEGREGGYLLRVRDDGQGFRVTPGVADAPGHLGLGSMRERAEMAGGWLRVDARLGLGTTVEAWVPARGVR
jgi:signal transduction histidine kinase